PPVSTHDIRRHTRFSLIFYPPQRFFYLTTRPPPTSTLFPYTTLFRSPLIEMLEQIRHALKAARLAVLLFKAQHPLHADRQGPDRSEEHTSELQSRENLVCRLLLEKKKKQTRAYKLNHR